LGDPDRAELILNRGVEDNSDYVSGLMVLGEVYLYKGFLRDAEEVVSRGLTRTPNHLGLLQLMLRIQKGLEAEQEVRRLRSRMKILDPLHISEDLSEEEAQPFAVSTDAEEQPAELTSPASIWKVKTAARRQREATAEAAELEAPAMVVETEAPPLHKTMATRTLGELYAGQNRFDEAIEIFQTLVVRNPGNESYLKRLNELKASREALLETSKDQDHG
jgi:tetratricopeptide (TPR) repeat protein